MSQARILIVEDDAILAIHLEGTITQLGYQVAGLAATSADAIKFALEQKPDVILMDIRLRDEVNGIQAANEIHEHLDIPVVYLTAYSDENLLQQAKLTDAYAYLTKPVRERELHASLEMSLYKHASEKRIHHLNQVLRSVRDVNQLITRERVPQRLLDEACAILMRTRGYRLALIVHVEKDRLRILSFAGEDREFINNIFENSSGELINKLPCMECFQIKQPVVCHDILHDERYETWWQEALNANLLSMVAIPIMSAGGLFGILSVYADQPNIFGDEEVDLLLELAGDMAFGLTSIREEKERKLAEASYRNIFENAPIGIFQSTPQGRFLKVNPVMARIYGYDSQQDMLESVHDIATQIYDSSAQRDEFKNLLAKQDEVLNFQASNLRKDGSVIWSATNARTIRNTEGEILYYEGFVRDITETKQAEESLHEREELFSALIANTGDLILLVDGEGIIRFASPSLTRILGYSPSDAIGKNYMSWAHPDDMQILLQAFANRSQNPGIAPHSTVARVRHKDGSWRILEGLGTNLLNDPYIKGFIINIRDVTEREQAEQELHEREAKYRSVIETAADGFWITDAEGRILEVNDEYLRQSGYTREELLNMRISEIEAGESTAEVEAHIQKIISTGSAIFEGAHRAKNGAIRPIEVSTSFTSAKGGRFFAFLRDISERKQAEEKIERQIQRLKALGEIDRTIISSFDLSYSLTFLLNHVIASLDVAAADVLLFDTDSQMLEYAAGSGFHNRAIEQTRIPWGKGYAGLAALERRTIFIADLADKPAGYRDVQGLEGENFLSYFAVPLIAKNIIKGVLEVFHHAALNPDSEWLEFLHALAGQAAIAIDDAQLFVGLQRSNSELAIAYDATIEGWSRAMDLRDKETEGHSHRVTELTLRLAGLLGVSDADKVHIRRGALLHDMGKLGVPDSILLKQDELTREEWAAMHRHPTYAYEMLLPITYLKPALEIPYCHHEKWDGTGYPRGLMGAQIPLAARIFAIVDVWDALRSDRPYRRAWSREKARDYIRDEAGRYFDPAIVGVFLNMQIDEEGPANNPGFY